MSNSPSGFRIGAMHPDRPTLVRMHRLEFAADLRILRDLGVRRMTLLSNSRFSRTDRKRWPITGRRLRGITQGRNRSAIDPQINAGDEGRRVRA
jgi:hypothetical protein